MTTHFFLGANSGEGFQSLYPDLADLEKIRDLIVLKGGPGVGKSTFMKQVGRAAEEAGQQVEYIWCSGDPDSLDAVLLPECAAAVVDGTSPHVVEPRYPAAVDRYVNLGQFYDVDALKKRRLEVVTHTEAYRPEKGFCDAVKGYVLYQARIVRPKELVVLSCKAGA